jgi:hypothetical protein
MYVDNVTGGVNDKENAMQVSKDIKSVVGNGGFRFKKTVMSGKLVG